MSADSCLEAGAIAIEQAVMVTDKKEDNVTRDVSEFLLE